MSIPRSQLYFWTDTWQEFEREASEELANGQGVTFDTPRDLLHWLLSEED